MTAVYLDYNATTPLNPDVLKAMLPYLGERFGNPSSAHALGRQAREAVEAARAHVANLIGAAPDEIIFTSGGTEANNIAIRGTANVGARTAIVTTTIEHPATESCCAFLEARGHRVTRVAANADAIVCKPVSWRSTGIRRWRRSSTRRTRPAYCNRSQRSARQQEGMAP